jgi:hypothetical protein
MGQADPIVVSVKALTKPLIEFDTADGYRVTSDLKKFEPVYCFPETQEEWEQVFEMDGDRIVWRNRFEIHVDQAVANEIKRVAIDQVSVS